MSNDNDYPIKDIESPHVHDVLCGRGGLSNKHVGNAHWRRLVAENKHLYCTLQKSQKQLLAKSIVRAVRNQNPPGRFLKKDDETHLWSDVGDMKAQEKTSQALREGASEYKHKRESRGRERMNDAAPTLPTSMSPPVGVQVSPPESSGGNVGYDVQPEHCQSSPEEKTSLDSRSTESPPDKTVLNSEREKTDAPLDATAELLNMKDVSMTSLGPLPGISFSAMSVEELARFESMQISVAGDKNEQERSGPLPKEHPALASQPRSTDGLLDDESDAEEEEAPRTKAADWEKMQAMFGLPVSSQPAQQGAYEAEGEDTLPEVPLTDLDRAVTTMSALSIDDNFFGDGESSPTSKPSPGDDAPTEITATTSGSPGSAQPHAELSEREKLEMEYLNRGESLVYDKFGYR